MQLFNSYYNYIIDFYAIFSVLFIYLLCTRSLHLPIANALKPVTKFNTPENNPNNPVVDNNRNEPICMTTVNMVLAMASRQNIGTITIPRVNILCNDNRGILLSSLDTQVSV